MASQKEYTMLFALNASLQSGFQASFGRAQQTISGLQKQINDLSKTQSNIAAYEKQQRAVESTRNKLEMYKQQLENLKGATASTSAEEAQLANAMLQKEAQIKKTEQALDGQTQKLNQMGDALQEAGVDTDHLTDESKRLEQEMEKLREEQEQAADGAQDFGDRTVAAFDAMASAIIAAGIVDKLKEIGEAYLGMVQTAGNFEASMSQVAATMGVSNAEVGQLGDFAKKMGAETSFSAVQAAEGLNILAMAGLNANDQMSGLPIVLNLAAAGGMDMADAATYVTASVKGFGDSMEHAGYYADLMAKGATLANTNVQGLGEAFSRSAATASSYGQAADTVTLALLRLADQNVAGEAAGTALNRAMADLYTPTKEAAAALKDLGVNAYDPVTRSARDFNDVIDDLDAALSGYTQEEANALKATIFTTNGLNAFNKMCASTEERVEALWTGIGEAGGSAAAQAKTQLDNMNGELTIMNSAMEGVQITMGDLYRDDMRQLYKMGTQLLTMINNFIKQNPGLVKGIIAAGTALGVLTTGVVGVSAAIKAFTALTTFLGPAMMATLGPIMAVVGGLSLLAGAFVMAYEHSDAKAIKDLTTESRGLESAMKDLHQKYETQAADNQATAATAQMYIDKLRDLEAAGLADDEQKRQYHNTLELLVQTMPSLADKIDLVNDSIEGGLPALEKATNDWKKMAEQQAQEEYLGELRQKVVEATKERIRNEQSLTAAQIKGENATRKQSEVYQQLLGTLGLTDAQFKTLYGNVRDIPWRSMSKDVQELYHEYNELGNEIKESETDQRQLSAALEESDAAIAAATTVVDEYTAAVEAQNAAAEASAGAQGTVEAAVEGVNTVLSGSAERLQALSEAYASAYEAAEKSITGQFKLWDEVGQTTAVSADTINQRLQEQTQHWSEYNDNLAKLRERTGDIEGLSDVIGSFADGSQESINAIAGMAAASDEDLQAMVTNYEALKTAQDETGQNIAALATNFDAETQNIANSVEQMVSGMNLSAEASAAAGETIQAYINKANSMVGPTESAFRAVANAAQRGLSSGGGGGAPEGKAVGGPVYTGKTYLVGEEGPELLRMSGNGTIIPHDETRKILSDAAASASGGDTISNSVAVTFQINGSPGAGIVEQLRSFGSEFEERVLEVLENAQADSMRRRYA